MAMPALLLLAAAAARSEVIDRIAVVVGTQVVTLSELNREIRITAFFNDAQPHFGGASRHQTADRLVEQKLVRKELEISKYPMPPASEIEPVLQELIRKRFGAEEKFRTALAAADLTEQDIREELLWQRTLLRFVGFRFQPAVQITDRDIQDYFEKQVAPEVRRQHPEQAVALEDFRDQIEHTLTGVRADKELDHWLKQTRSRTHIEYREDIFK